MNAIVNFKGLTGDAMDSKKDFLDHTDEASLHLDGAASLPTILQSAIEGDVVSSERAAKLIDGALTLIDHSYEALCSEKTGNWSTVMDLIESAEAGLDCLKKGILKEMDVPSKKNPSSSGACARVSCRRSAAFSGDAGKGLCKGGVIVAP